MSLVRLSVGGRGRAATLAVLAASSLCACDVTAIVGYDEGTLSGPLALDCAPDASLHACATSPCVVRELFQGDTGSPSVAADDEDVFYVSAPNVLGKQAIAGGSVVELDTQLDQMLGFTADATSVYWIEFDNHIWSVAKAGGEPLLAAGDFGPLAGHPRDVAVDDAFVYTVLPESGHVVMVPKPSGPATMLSGQASPVAVATDGGHVYWLDEGTAGPTSGSIVRAVRGDLTTAKVIVSNLETPVTLAIGESDIFWTTESTLFKIPKTGGEPQKVAGDIDKPQRLATFEGYVYLSSYSGLSRVPTGGGTFEVLDNRPMLGLGLACSGVYASGWDSQIIVRYGK